MPNFDNPLRAAFAKDLPVPGSMPFGRDRDGADSVKLHLTALTFLAFFNGFLCLFRVAVLGLRFAVDADPVNIHWAGIWRLWLVFKRGKLADLANQKYVDERVILAVPVGTRTVAAAHFERRLLKVLGSLIGRRVCCWSRQVEVRARHVYSRGSSTLCCEDLLMWCSDRLGVF